MPYRQLAFTSDNHVVSQKLTHWTKTGIGSDGAEWHPRVDYEETIVYDSSGNGISATTLHEYNGDLGYKETPVLENKTTSYAFVPAANGSSLTPGGSSTMPSIPSATPTTTIRVSELTYLIDDPNYSGIKSYYTDQNINGLVTVSKVKDGSGNVKAKTEIFYDEVGTYPIISAGTDSQWVDPGTNYRGNVTTTKSYYDITNSLFVATHAQYDNFGNQRKSWDGRGHLSQTDYSQTYAYAYPTGTVTQIPDPLGKKGSMISFTTEMTYDYDAGLPLTATDVNGQVTTLEYNDPLLRPTKVTAPNGQETITEYGAGVNEATRYVRSRVQIDSTPHWKESYNWYDGLGRTYKTQSVDTVAGDEYVLTCYDNVGRVEKVSNPFRNLLTQDCYTANGTNDIYWTTNSFDDAGRPWKVTTPDGAVVETNYGIATSGSDIGTTVTVADQAGKLRRSITNALGHLTRVDEPNANNQLGDIDNPNQPTNYNYDTLNNLLTVTQGAQTRTFVYDSLSRLLSAANPESGTINYDYDENSNLTSKTDARSVTTSYTYDGLNRVTLRDYSDSTPDVDYYYDNVTNAKGKLTKVSSSVSTTEYTSFDILGRVTGHKQTTGGTAYNTAYTYDLSGALIEETYPSGRKVRNTLDADGNLSLVETKPSGGSYQTRAGSFTYNAAGAVTSMQLGNGRWESTVFNNRLQPTQIGLGTTQNGTDLLKLEYGYGTTANNGNVLSQKITVPGLAHPFEQTYTYDPLNRIASATETYNSTQTWTQVFGYDRYGNRNITSGTGATSLTFNASNNRITSNGYTFDASGNTTADPSGNSYTYDAENKMLTAANGSTLGNYVYAGDGKRVKKTASTGDNTIFVYDAFDKLIEERDSTTGTLQTTYVYAGSRLLSTETSAGTTYLTADHLGSPRINTDSSGNVVARHDYLPFGEEIDGTGGRTTAVGYTSDTVRKQFTGYERDAETDLDFAQARYSNSNQGRFSSPDPLLASAKIANPQSLNRYSYVLNNPLKFVDPNGLKPVYIYKDLNGSVTRFIYLDDSSKEYKNYIKNGYALYKPKTNETFIGEDGHIHGFKNGLSDLGPAPARAIVNYWPSSTLGPGHLSVKLIFGNQSLYISFYPRRLAGTPWEIITKIPVDDGGSLKEEGKEGDEKPEVISIDNIDWKAAKEYYEKLKANPGKWSLGRDCADIVAEVLTASGVDIKNNQRRNSTIPGTVQAINEGVAKPRVFNRGVTWKSNYSGGVPDW
ncbi:MAG: RHS repeat protein [Chloracidobacterium sp.]|nr:RHS repeat protein [Chloracidobacterium sp.]MCO5333747.1 hypothetical protein [Pyrinomonadaceae bacterium]